MHIFPWVLAGVVLLKSAARRLIQSADQVHVSAALIWEIAIKAGLPNAQALAEPVELLTANAVLVKSSDSVVLV